LSTQRFAPFTNVLATPVTNMSHSIGIAGGSAPIGVSIGTPSQSIGGGIVVEVVEVVEVVGRVEVVVVGSTDVVVVVDDVDDVDVVELTLITSNVPASPFQCRTFQPNP
jgi:hypothetical protein